MGNEGQSWLPHQKIQSAWKGMRKEPVMKDRNKGKSEVTYKRLEGDCRFRDIMHSTSKNMHLLSQFS